MSTRDECEAKRVGCLPCVTVGVVPLARMQLSLSVLLCPARQGVGTIDASRCACVEAFGLLVWLGMRNPT